jgi:hypothetical protein
MRATCQAAGMRIFIAIGAAALMLLAGCSGSKDTSTTDTQTSDSSSSDGGNGGGGGNGGNGGSGGSGAMKWSEESVSGNFQLATPGGASGATGAIQPFNVPANTTEVYLNITITSTVPSGTPATEFEVDYHDPDHQAVGDKAQGFTMTTNGAATVLISGPIEGKWSVSIFSSAAPNTGSFVLKVNSHMPA